MNPVVHFEIPAKDIQRANKFYEDMFGWKIMPYQAEPQTYFMANTTEVNEQMRPLVPGAINGSIISDPSVASPVVVVGVDDIDAAIQKIESLGGKLVMPKKEFPGIGFFARVIDSEGNVIGIWKALPMPEQPVQAQATPIQVPVTPETPSIAPPVTQPTLPIGNETINLPTQDTVQ